MMPGSLAGLTNLEQAALLAESAVAAGAWGSSAVEAWTAFGLKSVFDNCAKLRDARIRAGRPGFHLKDDGSPSTEIELEVEEAVKADVFAFDSQARFVGEETGGMLSATGATVAVDPVDGTWSYISGTETCSLTLAVFVDGRIEVGAVGSPVTGEIAYASREVGARIIQLGFVATETASASLPLYTPDRGTILVNVHPSRAGSKVVQSFYQAWNKNDVRLVRSTGGSPSWALVDVAKGLFTYTSLWDKRVAEPFDLAAGSFIVRCAGGDVVGVDGESIHPDDHRGPFIAGVHFNARERIRTMIEGAHTS